MNRETTQLSGYQQVALVALRTLVGWHFLYEGLYKLWGPAWSRDGAPLARWSSAGYMRAATGPLADLFHGLAGSRLLPAIDAALPFALLLVGLSLLLGLMTRWGAAGALLLLTLFYLASLPTAGTHQAGAEGAYLLVNKNLVEAAAVAVLLSFRTDQIAGLDLLRRRTPPETAGEAVS